MAGGYVTAPGGTDYVTTDVVEAILPFLPKLLGIVQARSANGAVVCDGFAVGVDPAAGARVPYEIRFRRSSGSLLLIVSYDGPALVAGRHANIAEDGQSVGDFDATPTKFGNLNAVEISLDSNSVDFHDLERHRSLAVTVGAVRFEMAMLPSDELATNMDACNESQRQHNPPGAR